MPMRGIRKVISTIRLKMKNRLPIMVTVGRQRNAMGDSETSCQMRCTLYAVRNSGLHRALRNAEGLRSQRVQMQAPGVKERNTEGKGGE
jgi:hypothetical protein